jgi:hypothetical protein
MLGTTGAAIIWGMDAYGRFENETGFGCAVVFCATEAH